MAVNPIVVIETTLGTFEAELFADKAPNTVANFVDLVNQKFYDGIIFHRVIRNFMVQTGDPTGTGTGGRHNKGMPAKKIADEFHPSLKHDGPGIFSMANSGPNSGDTQIFITTVKCDWLDNKHAVFGRVQVGQDIVKAIESVPTASQDRPVNPPKIVSARIKE